MTLAEIVRKHCPESLAELRRQREEIERQLAYLEARKRVLESAPAPAKVLPSRQERSADLARKSAEVAGDVAAFLAGGGKIRQIPIGTSAYPPDGRHNRQLTIGRITLGKGKRPLETL